MDSAFTVPNQLKTAIRQQVAQTPLPIVLSDEEERKYIRLIKRRLKQQDAVLIVHYYTNDHLQTLADETGGCVADSLGMAQFGARHAASTLIVVGVRFMGETAKIINPEKRVLMPDLAATCSLDLSCPAAEFKAYCEQHPQRIVVVYANTSAAVKASAHWVVTSSNAVDIIKHLKQQGKKFIWAPDKHLGRYLQQQTGADMLIWQGYCVVHDEFNAQCLKQLMDEHPQAEVLVHPESPPDVIALADVVGSTTKLIKAARLSTADTLIVATDYGIFHKMNQAAPGKKLLLAPTLGAGPSCTVCAHCPWMARNNLVNLADTLDGGGHEILVAENIRKQALAPIQRMLEFSQIQSRTPVYA